MLWSDNPGTKDFAHEKHTKAPAGAAAAGALAGALLGAVLGWFLCIHPMAIAGLEPLIAAGPVIAAFAGAGAGGALGSIIGCLAGLSAAEYIAKRYAGRIRRGGILLSVHCDSPEWCKRAKSILRDTGGRGIFRPPPNLPPIMEYRTSLPSGRQSPSPRPTPLTFRPPTVSLFTK